MEETRSSLLVRVRDPTDSRAWTEFTRMYRPFLLNIEWHVLNQQPAGEVGVRLGLKANAVYQNAHRVLQQIRKRCAEFEEELAGV